MTKWQRRVVSSAAEEAPRRLRRVEPHAWQATVKMAPKEKPPLVGALEKFTKLGMLANRSGMSDAIRKKVVQQEIERRKILEEIRRISAEKVKKELERKRQAEEERIRKKEERAAQLEADRVRREEERKIRETQELRRKADFEANKETPQEIDPEEEKRMRQIDAADREKRNEAREAHRRALEERQRNKMAAAQADREARQLPEQTTGDWRQGEEVEFDEDDDHDHTPEPATFTIAEKMKQFTTSKILKPKTPPKLEAKAEAAVQAVSEDGKVFQDELSDISLLSHIANTAEIEDFDTDTDIALVDESMLVRRTELKNDEKEKTLPELSPTLRMRMLASEYDDLPGGPKGPSKTYKQWKNDFGETPTDDIKWVIASEGFVGGIQCLNDFHTAKLKVTDEQRAALIESSLKKVAISERKFAFETIKGVEQTFADSPPGEATLEMYFKLAGKIGQPSTVKSAWEKYCTFPPESPSVYFSAIQALTVVPTKIHFHHHPIIDNLDAAGKIFDSYCQEFESFLNSTDIISDPYSQNKRGKYLPSYYEAVEKLIQAYTRMSEFNQAEALWTKVSQKSIELPVSVKKAYLRKLTENVQPEIEKAVDLIESFKLEEKGEDIYALMMTAYCKNGDMTEAEKYWNHLPKTSHRNGRGWVANRMITGYAQQAVRDKQRENPLARHEMYVTGVESVIKRIEELGSKVQWDSVIIGLRKLYTSIAGPLSSGTLDERKEAKTMMITYSDTVREKCGYPADGTNLKCTALVTYLIQLYLAVGDKTRANSLVGSLDRSTIPPYVDLNLKKCLHALSERKDI